MKTYAVTMRWATPAWDEKDGITVEVDARSKSDAIKSVRREMDRAGHMGRRYYTAVEIASEPEII